MTSSDVFNLAISISILGVILVAVGVISMAGRLPLNPLVGIRLSSTMMSDAAWKAGHKAAGPYVILCGLCCFGGAALTVAAPSLGAVTIALVTAAAVVACLIVATIVASKAATRASLK